MTNEVANKKLWDDIKTEIKNKYKKRWNAYYSGLLVQEYKKRGGTYKTEKKPSNLSRWFIEKWTDIGQKSYPVYRPTVRVNRKTPLTVIEIDKQQLKKQIDLKQKIKERNLPAFKKKA